MRLPTPEPIANGRLLNWPARIGPWETGGLLRASSCALNQEGLDIRNWIHFCEWLNRCFGVEAG